MRVASSLPHAVTRLFAAAVKVVGLASAFNQLLLQPHPSAIPLAVSAFMLAGAQVSQQFAIAVLDRLFLDQHHSPGQESGHGSGGG